jgi:two-component system, response regulator
MSEPSILLVEDSASDEALTLRAFKKAKIANEIAVVHDGQEALDYLFGAGAHAGRDVAQTPRVILLDLGLPKIGGLDVLRRIRADARTKLIPVVLLTSSKEDKDILAGYSSGANSYVTKPVDFVQFSEAVRQVGVYWLLVNQISPVPAPGDSASRSPTEQG